MSGFSSPNRHIRRASYRLALTVPGEYVPQVFDQAFRELDPIIRTCAARQASAVMEQDALRSMLSVIERDPYMPVRRIALKITIENFPDKAHQALLAALLDANATIREVARYYLRRMEPMDFAAFYREALATSTGNKLLGALHGIGESGIAADVERLLPYSARGTIRIRKAALHEIAHLQGDAHLSLFMEALVDAQPGLSNAGRDALLDRVYLIDTARLAEDT